MAQPVGFPLLALQLLLGTFDHDEAVGMTLEADGIVPVLLWWWWPVADPVPDPTGAVLVPLPDTLQLMDWPGWKVAVVVVGQTTVRVVVAPFMSVRVVTEVVKEVEVAVLTEAGADVVMVEPTELTVTVLAGTLTMTVAVSVDAGQVEGVEAAI